MLRHFACLFVAIALLGCPKAAPTSTIVGTDDEMVDQFSAQLEEARTKTDLQCNDWCAGKTKVCEISNKMCEIAGRNADRAEFQKKCQQAQEDCAKYQESCSSCSTK